ncbi:MAG: DUF5131 family protein [Bradymonadales bacterium]
MNKTKIDWCDATINPVVGCSRGCEYCYARKINDRFHIVPDFSKPQFFPERLKQFGSKKPKSIFVNSMSDAAEWSDEFIEATCDAMKNNPQHNYIFLSKDFEKLADGFNDYAREKGLNKLEDRLFLGLTFEGGDFYLGDYRPDFYNFEPLLNRIDFIDDICGEGCALIIIGAETGNRHEKIIPHKEWIDDIVREADRCGIPVFMKESLRNIMGADFRQDKLIWATE